MKAKKRGEIWRGADGKDYLIIKAERKNPVPGESQDMRRYTVQCGPDGPIIENFGGYLLKKRWSKSMGRAK